MNIQVCRHHVKTIVSKLNVLLDRICPRINILHYFLNYEHYSVIIFQKKRVEGKNNTIKLR